MKLDKKSKEKRPELDHIHIGHSQKVIGVRPYGLDLAPSDYNLFRSFQNHLNGKTFDSNAAVKNKLIQYFASKNQTFYESKIIKLTKRWQKVIEQNGQYIIC